MWLRITHLYRLLKDHYGEQHWWPADTPFEVAVGAILTQNTSWKNVEKAIYNLKKHNCITPERILQCKELEELIKPAGFYRQKAERLKNIASFFLRKDIDKMSTEKLREELLNIKGVGKETADSILLYAFDRPVFVVDKYTYRLFVRLGVWKGRFDYEGIRNLVEREIKDVGDLKEFHALIVEHSKRICKKKPLCNECFIGQCPRIPFS